MSVKISKLAFLALFFSLISICCKDDNSTEPQPNNTLIGIWKVSSMSWDGSSESGSYNQDELNNLGIIWNLEFKSDKSAVQITNLSGPVTTQNGTWSIENGKLTLKLKAPNSEEMGTMVYDYQVEGNMLELKWSMPYNNQNNSADFLKN
jgi:hypothetical protein